MVGGGEEIERATGRAEKSEMGREVGGGERGVGCKGEGRGGVRDREEAEAQEEALAVGRGWGEVSRKAG